MTVVREEGSFHPNLLTDHRRLLQPKIFSNLSVSVFIHFDIWVYIQAPWNLASSFFRNINICPIYRNIIICLN